MPTPALTSFLEGLLGGVSASWAKNMMDDNKRQMDFIGAQLQQGNYEVWGMLDPNIKSQFIGKQNVAPMDQLFSNLSGLKQQQLDYMQQAQESKLSTEDLNRRRVTQQMGITSLTAPIAQESAETQLEQQKLDLSQAQAGAETKSRKETAAADLAESQAEAAEVRLKALPEQLQLELRQGQQTLKNMQQTYNINNTKLIELNDRMAAIAQLKASGDASYLDIIVPERRQAKIRELQARGEEAKAKELEFIAQQLDDPSIPIEVRRAMVFPGLAGADSKTQQRIDNEIKKLVDIERLQPRNKETQEKLPFSSQHEADRATRMKQMVQERINQMLPEGDANRGHWETMRIPKDSGLFGHGGALGTGIMAGEQWDSMFIPDSLAQAGQQTQKRVNPLSEEYSRITGTKAPAGVNKESTNEPAVPSPGSTAPSQRPQADAFKLPSDAAGQRAIMQAIRRAKATRNTSSRVGILVQAGIPQEVAQNAVDNGTLDALEAGVQHDIWQLPVQGRRQK